MHYLLLLVALAAGAMVPYQPLLNARLGLHIGGAAWASLVTFVVGLLALIAYVAVMRIPFQSSTAPDAPWYAWTGGVFGAFIVLGSTLIIPKLGATVTITLMIVGQLVASVAFDHFGVLMEQPQPVTMMRVFGLLMLVAGAWLVLRPSA